MAAFFVSNPPFFEWINDNITIILSYYLVISLFFYIFAGT